MIVEIKTSIFNSLCLPNWEGTTYIRLKETFYIGCMTDVYTGDIEN